MNTKEIMKNAWVIYRTMEGDHIAKLKVALTLAWADYKEAASKKSMEEKLIEKGYRVWAKGGHRRIYINDYASYLKVEQIDDVVSYGHKNLIVEGVDLWEVQEKQSHFNTYAKVYEEYGEIPSMASFYYDCKEDRFAWNRAAGSYFGEVENMFARMAAEKIRAI